LAIVAFAVGFAAKPAAACNGVFLQGFSGVSSFGFSPCSSEFSTIGLFASPVVSETFFVPQSSFQFFSRPVFFEQPRFFTQSFAFDSGVRFRESARVREGGCFRGGREVQRTSFRSVTRR